LAVAVVPVVGFCGEIVKTRLKFSQAEVLSAFIHSFIHSLYLTSNIMQMKSWNFNSRVKLFACFWFWFHVQCSN